MRLPLSKPIRIVLKWQLIATAVATLAAALVAGQHAAASAAAGGAVSIVAGMAAATIAALGRARSAGGVLASALRAEAVKLGLALVLLCAGSSAQQYKFDVPRQVQCTAHPACGKPGAACKAVEHTYKGAAAGSAKDSIVRACVEANRPDPCGNCVQHCRQVARCSKI